MTSGMIKQTKKYHKKALLLLAFFFALPAYALEVNNPDVNKRDIYKLDVKKLDVYKLELPELLNLFSQNKQSTVDFNEEKHTFYLEQPIKSSGYLQFSAPDKLNKIILKPEKTSQKINGNKLEINNNNETQTINLDDYPEFSIILRSIINVLSGNHSALKKDFKINYENDGSGWTLSLLPHDSYVLSYVESIKMFGNKNKLSKIIVTEPNNDRSITHLYNHR